MAALSEISSMSVDESTFTVNQLILAKLLAALNECTEYIFKAKLILRWGQICILTSLAKYKPSDAKEACDIVERVIPRLQHANASVVLEAVKVL